MSYNCMIGILTDKGQVEAIYCHQDGQTQLTGAVLMQNFQEREKVLGLIASGHINYLSSKFVPAADHKPKEIITHTSISLETGEVTAIHRIDSEKREIDVFTSEEWYSYICKGRRGVSHYYLYKEGQWYIDGQPLTRKRCGFKDEG